MRYGYLFWGLLSGLIGGVAGAMILWGSWLLPALGLILTRVSLINGLFSLLFMGSLGGLIYAAVVKRKPMKLISTVLAGLVAGAILWVAGPLLVVPLILGLPPQLGSPLDHWMPLLAFLLYGLIVSFLYSRWGVRQGEIRLKYAASIFILAILITPFLLRAALSTSPDDLELPPGYRAEVVAKGFTYPTGIALDEKGNVYVAESGFAYGPKETEARILKVTPGGEIRETAGGFAGPLNGLELQNEMLYVSHRGKITAFNMETEERKDLVVNLPSLGDHHNNDLIIGADGALYFGQGTATNSGVVGADNFIYAWADRYPDFHDLPSRDYVLTGENYESPDPGTFDPVDTVNTGAFAPFGETRERGEEIKGVVPASGAVHRLDVETGDISIYADGLRNPYGLALDQEGVIYTSNLGYDDRGSRAASNSPDWLVLLREGAWYGWPDYAGELSLTEPLFASDRGINRRPVLVDPPPVEPPLTTLPPHYSPMKLDFAPDVFPDAGLYVAIFGDGQPLTEDLDEIIPTGIMRVNPVNGRFDWFIRNKDEARAGRGGGGLKRVIDVKFSPEGEMYLLDFGVMEFTDMAPNAIPRTGVLWKIKPE